MNKKVIYTCLVGGYDQLEEPKVIYPGWDYICFSNDWQPKKNSVWKVRPIGNLKLNNTRLSRVPKLKPNEYLPEYDYSVYIDANIVILDNYLLERVNVMCSDSNVLIAANKHPERNCIYDEADKIIEWKRENKWKVKRQINYLKKNEFPVQFGLYENNILYRNHTHPSFSTLCNNWWEIYKRFTRRDQLSLAYILWKNNVKCTQLFGIECFNVRESNHFKYILHSNESKVKSVKDYRRQLFRIKNNEREKVCILFGINFK
jgi:hypothetical protein